MDVMVGYVFFIALFILNFYFNCLQWHTWQSCQEFTIYSLLEHLSYVNGISRYVTNINIFIKLCVCVYLCACVTWWPD